MEEIQLSASQDRAQQLARFFFSTGDELVEYTRNELNEMADGSWDR